MWHEKCPGDVATAGGKSRNPRFNAASSSSASAARTAGTTTSITASEPATTGVQSSPCASLSASM